jgi:hypothetical protein
VSRRQTVAERVGDLERRAHRVVLEVHDATTFVVSAKRRANASAAATVWPP